MHEELCCLHRAVGPQAQQHEDEGNQEAVEPDISRSNLYTDSFKQLTNLHTDSLDQLTNL